MLVSHTDMTLLYCEDVTGPADSDRAILAVYDIFGFFPQTIQGADILAYGDADRKYQVFMPDFFEGNTAELEWYPPTDDDKKAKIGKWFQEVAVVRVSHNSLFFHFIISRTTQLLPPEKSLKRTVNAY